MSPPSPVFRQGGTNQLLSQQHSSPTLPRAPYRLDKPPAVGSSVTKSPPQETPLHLLFPAHVRMAVLPPGLMSQPSSLPDPHLTPLLHCLYTFLWNFTHHHLPQPPTLHQYQGLSPLSSRSQPPPLSPKWAGPPESS